MKYFGKSVTVYGHPREANGMGEHCRNVWRALNAVGAEVSIVDIYGVSKNPDNEFEREAAASFQARLECDISIFCINGNEVEECVNALRSRGVELESTYSIIFPMWELAKYPQEWAEELDRFDEIWVSSEFVRLSIGPAVSNRVFTMPLACEPPPISLKQVFRRDIRPDCFLFFFAFDFLSFIERKNPYAALRAFNLVLERSCSSAIPHFLIKTNNSQARPEDLSEFRDQIEEMRNHVTWVDGTLKKSEMGGLLWRSDCFISLHRSEGFGFGMAEAMSLGIPVVCTGYSGNMAFCNSENAKLVDYELKGLNPGDYPHWEGQEWAEPSIEHAAQCMMEVMSCRSEALAISRSGSETMADEFSFFSVGLNYVSRLHDVV